MNDEYDMKKIKNQAKDKKFKPDPGAAKTTITIRVDNRIIVYFKDQAEKTGIPYQTLIQSVLLQYTNGQIVDKDSQALRDAVRTLIKNEKKKIG